MNLRLQLALGLAIFSASACAQEVSAKFTIAPATTAHKNHLPLDGVVLWLTPEDASTPIPNNLPHSGYRLVQKNKMFSPHLIVVPTGSAVDFPNQDPFFHNVFSLFNGKRFDLGLYESGTSRSVRFDREGVSYIFCNIHPEMGAIVLALRSPWFAISTADGAITLHNVPPGRYHVNIWGEQLSPTASDASRIIQVTAQGASLGTVPLVPSTDPLAHHKNKFGQDYPPTPGIY